MALKFGLALAILLFPTVSGTNDHKSRTIEVHHDGRGRRSPGSAPKEGSDSAEETSAKTVVTHGGQTGEGCSKDDVEGKFGTTMKVMKNQMVNDCPGAMNSGTSCTPACKDGMSGFGSIVCVDGVLESSATCSRACTISPPTNGGLGDCPNSMLLQQGTDCQYSCEVQYHPTGRTECLNDDAGLNEAQCVQDPLINQAYDKEHNSIPFLKMSSMSISQSPANEVFTDDAAIKFKYLGNWDTECYFIKSPKADATTSASEVQMTIKIARPVTVFVCLPDGNEQRIEGQMKWKRVPADGGSSETGWNDAQTVQMDGHSMEGPIITGGASDHGQGLIYRKNFNVEEIRIPGNQYETTNYLVFVCPQDGTHCSAESVGDAFPEFAKAPNMNSNSGCDGRLQVEASCQPECHHGYFATGAITCTLEGLKSSAKCVSAAQDAQECSISVPQDGTFEGVENTCNQNGTLAVGETCRPGCLAGYQVAGEFRCYITEDRTTAHDEASCDEIVESSSLVDASETPKKLMRSANEQPGQATQNLKQKP